MIHHQIVERPAFEVLGKKTWMAGQESAALETYHVPAAPWAVFECRGKVPDAMAQAEIFAFTRWLPASGYEPAAAPEMEVHPPGDNEQSETRYGEFWLPIVRNH